MASKAKYLLSGRTSLAALLFLMVAVAAGCFMLVRRAEAQTPGTANPVEFAPTYVLDNGFVDGGGNIGLNIHCLLPAVQNASAPFEIKATTPDGDLIYQVPIGGRTFGWYTTYIYHTYKRDGITIDKYYLVIVDYVTGNGEQRVISSGQEQVALSIQPATRGNGESALPTSACMTIVGYKTDAYDDTGDYFPYEVGQAPYSK